MSKMSILTHVQCDGVNPSCGTCIIANSECKYHSPEASLKQRLEELEAEYRYVTHSVTGTHEPGHQSATGLKELTTASLSSADAISSVDTCYPSHQESFPGQNSSSKPQAKLRLSQWTKVSNDDDLLSHLFSLFWTWERSLTRILHREMLLDSLSAEWDATSDAPTTTQTEFCSELLVNSILAISMVSGSMVTAHFSQANDYNLSSSGLLL